jgi:hypothetical protein
MLQVAPVAQLLLHQPPVHFMLQLPPVRQSSEQLPDAQSREHLLSFSHFMAQAPPWHFSLQVSPDLQRYRQAPWGQSLAETEASDFSESPPPLAAPFDAADSEPEAGASAVASLVLGGASLVLGVDSAGGDP